MPMTAQYRSRARRRQRLAAVLASTLALLGLLVVVVWGATRSGVGMVASSAPSPITTIRGIDWPQLGASAAWTTTGGGLPGPSADRVVPIASVAKVMTAYVVLRDHPLAQAAAGPVLTVSSAEAAAYPSQRAAGESLVPVEAGERISERQALDALMLPSADNMAWILARWDAGSVAAFVARMNTVASAMGLSGTHYTDPSGLASSTVSTAADQVLLGRRAMSVPAFAATVSQTTATVPVAGRIANLDTLLGTDGVVGIKTGSTSAAGGCVLLAARRGSQLVVVAVLGQPGSADELLPHALSAGSSLVRQLVHS